MDRLIQKSGEIIHLLMNRGNICFDDPINFSGVMLSAKSTSAANVSNDRRVDTPLANLDNEQYANQLLINKGDSSFHDPINFPGVCY